MSKWQGERLSIEIYGASHGDKIGVKCKNFPKLKINQPALAEFMKRRQGGQGVGTTPRKEEDLPEFISGVTEGEILTGDFEAVIYNKNKRSSDYNELYAKPRPSHADYCDYLTTGNLDFRGGGRFSARLTAPFCVAGYVAKQYLNEKGVTAYAYIQSVGKVNGRSYKQGVTEAQLKCITGFPSIDKKEKMEKEIQKAQKRGDSVGAVCECVIFGVKGGIGGDYFSNLEGKIANLLYSIPAVKGVEFGGGFTLSQMNGSTANDNLYYEGENVVTKTNNSGGINGGITNGMPITCRVAFRPTPSISIEQDTVDLEKKQNVKIKIKGRHDSCVAVRALPVIESAIYLSLLDIIGE